jgi:trk system potassium uptake protein TrkA
LVHVIIVGCGRVGSELGVRLLGEGHTVAIIDRNSRAFRRLPDGWGGQTVVGFGFDRDHLTEAGVDRADAVAAVTSGDNTNILTARIARETFGIQNVVARIYDPRRALIYQRLGISTVATVTWTTDQVARRLFPERSSSAWTDPSGEVSMVERAIPPIWAGQPLSGLIALGRYQPVLVTRGGQARLFTPDLVGQEGDVLLFAVHRSAIEALESKLSPVLKSRLAPAGRDGQS